MMLRFIQFLFAGIILAMLAACATTPTGESASSAASSASGACYRDSCCNQPKSLAFPAHRTRCEALGEEKTARLLEADKGFTAAIRQAREVPEDQRRTGRQVLCLALVDSGRAAESLGEVSRAVERYTEATRECANIYGSSSEAGLRAQIGLANALIDGGKLPEASTSLQALLDVAHRHENKSLQAAALDAFGRLEDRRGDHSKARNLLRQALELRQRELGERSVEAGITMIHLGDNAMLLRGWADARGWYDRGLDAIEMGLGKRNRYYFDAKTALVASFLRDRRYEALPPIYTELLNLGRDLYGPLSEEYAGTLNDAAALQYIQRQYAPAYERFVQTADIRRQTMPGSLLLGWTDLNAAKARLEIAHCGTVKPLLVEAQDILVKQKRMSPPEAELPEYGAEFNRVAQLCAAHPEPVTQPAPSKAKPKRKR